MPDTPTSTRPARRPEAHAGRTPRSTQASWDASPHSFTRAAARHEQQYDDEGTALVDRQHELEEMVRWETNELANTLKHLSQQEGPQDEATEEWARRVAGLRQLLREREQEVAHLQSLLADRTRTLGEGQVQIAEQARIIREQEVRILELVEQLQQLQQQRQCAPSRGGKASMDADAIAAISVAPPLKWSLPVAPALPAAAADSCCVQLPAQSYAEYQDCGFWRPLTDSLQQHPRRWAVGVGGALLLLVLLLATVIPLTRHKGAAPQFAAGVVAAATGPSWIDLNVRLDRPGLVSYLVVRQTSLGVQVAGEGATLLQLMQRGRVSGRAVYEASAPGAGLEVAAGGGAQPGLAALAVACGWAPVPVAGQSSIVSVLSAAAGSQAAACANAPALGHCARCPQLEDGVAYTVLLVAGSLDGRELSELAVATALTGGGSLDATSTDAPFVDNVTAISLDLHFQLRAPGTMHYVVVYDQQLVPFGGGSVVFDTAPPSSAAVLAAAPAAFLGGVVASGRSVAVEQARQWHKLSLQPPCVANLCEKSLYGLQGRTGYRIYLVGVDSQGVPDPAPAMAAFTTAPGPGAPALLVPTGPANISATSFGMAVSTDAAGAVYFALLTAKPGTAVPDPGVAPGSWKAVAGLAAGSTRRRLQQLHSARGSRQAAARQLADAAANGSLVLATGSLVAPACPPGPACAAAPSTALAGLGDLAGTYDTVASGCARVPAAGQALALNMFEGLQNNTVYWLLLATEDVAGHVGQAPTAWAVRTVDLSAPRFACGFPLASNITATSFALAVLLTKPAEAVFYVVLPAGQAAAAPSAEEVLQGRGPSGAAAAAAGRLAQAGWLPWEAAPGSAGDPRRLWANVTGLASGGNYTAFLVLATAADGGAPVAGSGVASLAAILTPYVVAPTFAALAATNVSVDEGSGTFGLRLEARLDRPGRVFYAMYRNYSCITGPPSTTDITVGAALPASVCKCDDPAYCQVVASGGVDVTADGLNASVTVAGDLSPLAFESLRNASDDKLKCFKGGLGQATDTYNVFLVAANAQPTRTGLVPQCNSFERAQAAVGGADSSADCPAVPHLACSQVQARPDQQTLQSGAPLAWPSVQNSSGSSDTLVWQAPQGASAAGRPARVQLSLESGAAPSFAYGPVMPEAMRTGDSFGLEFAMDRAALVVYGVFRPMPLDDSGSPQPPVLIATGRVPVFSGGANYSTGPIRACTWAPGGAMQPGSTFYVSYVARDKYGRLDGPCPGQAPGGQQRICTALAATAS